MRAVRKSFGLELISELTELVEINARPEPERVGNCFRCRAAAHGRLAQPRTDRPIDRFLKGDTKLPRTALQKPGEVVIDGQRRSHAEHHG